MTKSIVDKVTDIMFEALRPGPAAFWHPYMWNKIHAVHISHTRRGLYGSDMAEAPKMMIEDIHNRLFGEVG